MPMILTLGMDGARLRPGSTRSGGRYFPPERNVIPAHLTLFQQLPASPDALLLHLARVGAATAPLPFTVAGVMSFSNGAAYALDMPGFAALHRRLRSAWARHLTPADDRPRKAHVTVQNKVPRALAVATQAALRDGLRAVDRHRRPAAAVALPRRPVGGGGRGCRSQDPNRPPPLRPAAPVA